MNIEKDQGVTMDQQQAVNQVYEYAAHLLFKEEKSPTEVKRILMEQGLDEDSAGMVIGQLVSQMGKAKRNRARRDMFWGAVWCIGGTVATLSNFGFIFWGAIIFGGIQFFRGLVNSME